MQRRQNINIFLVCLIASLSSSAWSTWEPSNPPYLVQVKLIADGSVISVGSLLGPNHVVTAADFLIGYLPENITVVGGVKYPSAEGVERNVSNIRILEMDPDIMWDRDVAILELSTAMEGENIGAVSLAADTAQQGDLIELLGWTFADEVIKPTVVVKLPIISNEECAEAIADFTSNVTDTMMCAYQASDMEEGICFSMLGSPVLHKGKLCGFVLQDVSCGHTDPAILTNITKVRDFIEKSMKP